MTTFSKRALFGLTILLSSFYCISQEVKYQAAAIAFYNLENLYDTINDPLTNDDEFTPEGINKFSASRYLYKLDHLSEVISQLGVKETGNSPIILGVCEVENRNVLVDLINTPRLKSKEYGVVHYDSPDKRGVDVGLIYQKKYFKVTSSSSNVLTMPQDTGFYTRAQLLVSGILDGENVHVIVNHWPSRRGGEKKSSAKRQEAATLSRSLVDSIVKTDAKAKVFVMGDFNDDPVDNSVLKVLKTTGTLESAKNGLLFNPMYGLYKKGIGTLAHGGHWNLFDMVVMTPSVVDKTGGGYKYHTVRIFNEPFLMQKEGSFKNYPFRTYVGSNFTGGYSDHFPVYVIISKKVE